MSELVNDFTSGEGAPYSVSRTQIVWGIRHAALQRGKLAQYDA